MRQLLVQVPRGRGSHVVEVASDLAAIGTARFEGERDGEPVDLIIANVSNSRVETFLRRIEQLPDVNVSLYPTGVLALKPPPTEAADQVTDVEMLSPIEVFLAGHQSVGSWRGFLGYACAAGAVVWVALYVGSIYLLTAAMLVAPFAGPAMNSAIATAAGERVLLRRSLVRYVAALGATVAVTYLLTLLLGPNTPSARMVEEVQVASVAVILPLVAGAAGALFLMSSERSSLVSGAAVGLLVAASLAPPAGVVGMAAALGRWDMVGSAAFVLALQLVGIHLSGAVVFRIFGLSHKGTRRGDEGRLLFPVGLGITVLLLAALLTLQFSDPINLSRTTLAQKISTAIENEVRESAHRPDHVSARFMKTPPERSPVLLTEVFVRKSAQSRSNLDSTQQVLTGRIQNRLASEWPQVTPVVDIRWVEGPQ